MGYLMTLCQLHRLHNDESEITGYLGMVN